MKMIVIIIKCFFQPFISISPIVETEIKNTNHSSNNVDCYNNNDSMKITLIITILTVMIFKSFFQSFSLTPSHCTNFDLIVTVITIINN